MLKLLKLGQVGNVGVSIEYEKAQSKLIKKTNHEKHDAGELNNFSNGNKKTSEENATPKYMKPTYVFTCFQYCFCFGFSIQFIYTLQWVSAFSLAYFL